MAAAATPGVAEQTPGAAPQRAVQFDLSQAPNIEGFNPLPKVKDETFKEKFARKTKENPFVPIGEWRKASKQTSGEKRCTVKSQLRSAMSSTSHNYVSA